jgi:nucleotide-binding universal stress UspA family protein
MHMNDIIVGVDRSETAMNAARKAAELAAALGANLHLVMCADRGKAVNMKVGSESFHTDWLSEAEQHLAEVSRKLGHDSITTKIDTSDPAKTLIEEAERLDARAVVVGNRRVQGASRVLGSIASDVLRKAPCDVLVANTIEA